MTLKPCSCGKLQTTKNTIFIGRGKLDWEYLLFECTTCRGSFTVPEKRKDIKVSA